MIQEIWINYYRIKYEDQETDISYAIDYLRDDLKIDEAKVFFEQAKATGQAQFEDDDDRQFTLQYNSGDNYYTLIKRDY